MEQATKLSLAERTTVSVALSRLVGDTFGSLATLPLFCLGDLHSPDPDGAISDHFDLWRSYLVVVRDVSRSAGFGNASPDALDELTECVTEIRDGYREICADHAANPPKALAAFGRLEDAYRRIPAAVRELGAALDVDTAFLPGDGSLKKASYERSLRWLGERLGALAAGAAGK